jgi:ABC-type phosphate/phosphonate transport system substrate-binding protein
MTRHARVWLSAAALALAPAHGISGQDGRPLLRYGICIGAIETANPNDVRAASVVWTQGIADAVGSFRGADAFLFSTPAAASDAINSGDADVLALSTLEYLAAERVLKASPAMVWQMTTSPMVQYVVLARAGTDDLSRAAGRSLALYATGRPWALSEMWADVALADAGVKRGQAALSAVRIQDKKGRAAMAVFFGQADFAIEDRAAFDTAVAMNPKMGQELKVLARSPELLSGLVCISDRMGPALRQQFVDKAIHLHESTRYQQTFVTMRVSRLLRWDPHYLDSARALLARHQALKTGR